MAAKWSTIIDEVCKSRRVFRGEVLSRKRYPKLVRARWEIMSRIRNETKLSTYQIGDCIGRDHATVLYGVRRWEEMSGE